MSVAPVVANQGQSVTLSATLYAPSAFAGSLQFHVDGANVGTPQTVNGAGTYSVSYKVAVASVDNTITAVFSPSSNPTASSTASNILTDPSAVGAQFFISGFAGPVIAFPGVQPVVMLRDLDYAGYIQFQIDGVNVGGLIQVPESAVPSGSIGWFTTFTIPNNLSLGNYTLGAILYSVNGVPLQTATDELMLVGG
jgi:hypothetical protein